MGSRHGHLTAEQWDTHRDLIFADLMAHAPQHEDDCDNALIARLLANHECTEQFGDRPPEPGTTTVEHWR